MDGAALLQAARRGGNSGDLLAQTSPGIADGGDSEGSNSSSNTINRSSNNNGSRCWVWSTEKRELLSEDDAVDNRWWWRCWSCPRDNKQELMIVMLLTIEKGRERRDAVIDRERTKSRDDDARRTVAVRRWWSCWLGEGDEALTWEAAATAREHELMVLLVDDREEQGEMLMVVTGRDADASEAERGRWWRCWLTMARRNSVA